MTAVLPAAAADVLGSGSRPDPFIVAPRSIRELLPGRVVTWEAPRDLGPCQRGMGCDRVAVATITWPDRDDAGGYTEVRTCRECLPAAVEHADDLTDQRVRRVDVAVPGWRPIDLPHAIAAMTPRQLDVWLRSGYLHCEDDPTPGSGYHRGLMCADEVVAAAAMAALVALDVSPRGARRLWDADPGLAAEVIESGRAGTGLRPPVGPDGEVYVDRPDLGEGGADPSCPDCGGAGGHGGPCGRCQR